MKAPSIGTLPDFDSLPADLRAQVAIKVGDNISTDEILPAGARVLPFRSDIARLAEFTFIQVDEGYVSRAREAGPHVIVAGDELSVDGLTGALGSAAELTVSNRTKNADFTVRHRLSPRQVAMVLAGGQIALVRSQQST